MAGDFLPYLKIFPAETLADERFAGWTVAERGAWFTFLLYAWTNGSIPSEEDALARIVHMPRAGFRKVWAVIADRFVPHPTLAGRLTSRRLEAEREEAIARAEAGKTGARSRWGKKQRPDSGRDATASPSQCDRIAEPMPAAQHSTAQISAAQIARVARMGVGHPAFEAVEHWRGSVWPRLSTAECPEITTSQAQSLAALSGKHGSDAVRDAMDAAAADEFWGPKLDLDAFVAKFPRWVGRRATGPPATGRGPQPVSRDYSKTLAET